MAHINIFTDESLASAFVKSGIDIISAWYFGMDIYELISQFAYCSKDNDLINCTKKYISKLQEVLDKSQISDGIILVGIPK